MTALNKTIRQEIIDSVISKGTTIPARKEDLKKATELRVRQACMARVPKEFGPATKNLPPEWFPIEASWSVPHIVCPISLSTMTDEEISRVSWRGHQVSFEPFRHPINTRFDRKEYIDQGMNQNSTPPTKKPDDLESWEAVLSDLLVVAKKIRADEEQARAELLRFLYSVNNYKQVLDKMPELEPHLPNYTKPMPLTVPVAPILRTLGALGFDKLTEPVKKPRSVKEKTA